MNFAAKDSEFKFERKRFWRCREIWTRVNQALEIDSQYVELRKRAKNLAATTTVIVNVTTTRTKNIWKMLQLLEH